MHLEKPYIAWRLTRAAVESVPFYLCRILPVQRRRIVFTTIEGTTGFACNPKYIALELIRRNVNLPEKERFELVWLVNDENKVFPEGIRRVKNTLWNRAHYLSTAGFWIDNSRKQLEVRKRRGQCYIQTWHAKLGFKPTGLDRGSSFSKIARIVTEHDSAMIDLWLSNSDWYDRTLATGSLYTGRTLRSGSPRCDILVNGVPEARKKLREKLNLSPDDRLLLFCPTFRGGSQGVHREIEEGDHQPDLKKVLAAMRERFGGNWRVLLRLHPQLTARGIASGTEDAIDVSRIDDLYEILSGCDAFLTDYSSAAFDAAVMRIPVFLYCDDYADYEQERGRLLWDMRNLPFPFAVTQAELNDRVARFDDEAYQTALDRLFAETGMVEDGRASERVADCIAERVKLNW